MAKTEKHCLACKRSLAGKGKYGMCPDCLNKYGTPAAAFAVLGLCYVGKGLLKGSGKAAKVAWNTYRKFKG